jgi:diadenosine tetraphosphatase ApaH/serine/threonine PP2A family protein phosphatase
VDELLHGGDLVGWGPQPNEVVALIAEEGIAGVVGNHELLCHGVFSEESALRNESTRWTAERLSPESRAWLGSLPAQLTTDAFLLSHASPSAWGEPPEASCFPYRHGPEGLERELGTFRDAATALILTGHVHEAAVHVLHLGGLAVETRRLTPAQHALDTPLPSGASVFVVAGAVGKPRDGVPAANYVLLDTQEGTVSLRRVSYDVESVCALLRETTLPQVLARELAEGR